MEQIHITPPKGHRIVETIVDGIKQITFELIPEEAKELL